MKRDRVFSALWGLILGTLLALSCVGCVATAFSLEVSWPVLAGLCAAGAAAGAIFLSFRRGWAVLLALLALLSGYLWRQGDFAVQTGVLLYRISRVYDMAYGWGILLLGEETSGPVTLPLAAVGVLAGLAAAWSVCRRKTAAPALLLGILSLGVCLVVTDTPPDTLPLFALIFACAMLLLTGPTRRQSLRRANRLTAYLALPLAAALAILALAVPKAEYQVPANLDGAQDRLIGATQRIWRAVTEGFSTGESSVDLSTAGPKRDWTYPVMEVTATTDRPLYLRERDYDLYTGTGWESSPNREERENWPEDQYLRPRDEEVTVHTYGIWASLLLPYYDGSHNALIGGRVNNDQRASTYTLTYRNLSNNWRASAPVYPPFFSASSTLTLADGQSLSGNYTHVEMDAGKPPSTAVDFAYLALPDSVSSWASQTAMQAIWSQCIAVSFVTTPVVAEAIADYVRSSAAYSLATPRMPEGAGDFAQWFLEESNTGYCVHFATATAVLLRAAGIPARYVEGYLVDAAAGETVTVTAGDAHAWVEYYLDGIGWIPLESTPGTGSGVSPADMPPAKIQPGTDTLPTAPTQPVTQPVTEPEPAPTAATPSDAPGPAEETAGSSFPFWTLLIAPLLAAAVWLQWYLRLRRQNQELFDPAAQTLKLWRRAERLAKALGEHPPEALLALAQQAKFSHHPPEGPELEPFQTYLADAQARLRRRNWYRRAFDRLVLALY